MEPEPVAPGAPGPALVAADPDAALRVTGVAPPTGARPAAHPLFTSPEVSRLEVAVRPDAFEDACRPSRAASPTPTPGPPPAPAPPVPVLGMVVAVTEDWEAAMEGRTGCAAALVGCAPGSKREGTGKVTPEATVLTTGAWVLRTCT